MMFEVFKDIEFFEDTHKYFYKGKQAGMSTTGFIHSYAGHFDEEVMAERVANKRGLTVEDILNEWHDTRDYACVKGDIAHRKGQEMWGGEKFEFDINNYPQVYHERLKKDLPILFKQAEDFYNDYKDMLEFVKDEQFLYDVDYDLAGSIDLLFKNKLTGNYVICDFKTNKEIKYKGYGKMQVPLNHLEDCNANHYFLQVYIYKHIVEKNTGIIMEEPFIVHFDVTKEDYTIIEPKCLIDEVKKILEIRGGTNMNSVPVLIYGKSGTGKSTSLRNFKKEEVAVINVLNKPMPFKSDLKVVALDEYSTIIKAIKGTKKKTIVIDDCGYLLSNETIKRGRETGFTKFTDIAQKFFTLIEEIRNLDGGKTVYIMLHEELDEVGNAKLKLTGKMLDQQVCIEGCFTIALRSMCSDGKYVFRTHNNGQDITKSPFDMFVEDEVENDLKHIDSVIREYYELDKEEEKEEVE